MELLGVDIGGSGIKAGRVDTATGRLLGERLRVDTPRPADPKRVAAALTELVARFEVEGPVGCGFPGVVRDGVVHTAANVSEEWLGEDARARFESGCGRPFVLLNDADAAGLAELRFGAGRGRRGVVLLLTLGTGIGSALFVDGLLVPNTELGHLEMDGEAAEEIASDRARSEADLSWKRWAKRLDAYLGRVRRLLWPDLVIIGGGVSKRHEKFLPRLEVDLEVVPAELRNHAGIVGAALAARERARPVSGAPKDDGAAP